MKRTSLAFTLAIVTVFSLSCTVVIADTCDHKAPRSVEVRADGARRVVIDAGAGSLKVRGVEGAGEVRAHGEACASRESVLDDVELIGDQRGDTVRIEARFPHDWNGNARLDFEVEVPSGLEVVIEDGSGSIHVEGVAALQVHDGSGDLAISNVAGNVGVDDGSGDIEILGVGGEVTVEDGSGDLEVAGVGGRVQIDDGSGDFEVRDADSDVVVIEDGSGNIRISGIGGDVIVREDGSGDIDVHDVRGDFRVENDGSGRVSHERIDGQVSIDD